MFKQVIITRQDLKLPKGKLAAQVAHASVDTALRTKKTVLTLWKLGGMKKVVLKVPGLRELKRALAKAKNEDLVATMITDAGLTTVRPGTVTCVGVGPASEKVLDKLFGDLKLL